MTEYTSRLTDSRYFLFTFLFYIFAAGLILIFFFVFRSTKPMRDIMQLLDNPASFPGQGTTNVESREIIRKILSYVQTSETLSDELNTQTKLLNDTKLLALQSQINPHFLLNTLNMIHMIEVDSLGYESEAPKMTLTLSKLLSYTLNAASLVSIETEFYYTKLFSSILNKRYENRIEIRFYLDEDSESVLIPKLIIQPLIENAVFHGISPKHNDRNLLEVSAISQGDDCILTVSDNGIGIAPHNLEILKKKIAVTDSAPAGSIGLHNVMLRMHLLFGEDFQFTIDSVLNEGTVIKLIFPNKR